MRKRNRQDLNKFSRISLFSLLILLGIVVIVIFVAVFFRNPKMYSDFETFSLGTYVHLKISTKLNPDIIAREIFAELDRITNKFDPYKEGSVIHKLNHSKDWVEVDDETFALIELALRYAKITDGAFDPSLGRLIDLWGFSKYTEKVSENVEREVPSELDINEALKNSGFKKIQIDYNKKAIKTNGVWIDLGGLAKGYALERAYQIAKSADQECTGFIEAGGDIRILGPKFGKDYWIIGIRNPRGTDSIDYIYLRSGAVATSGDYERYFIKDGIRYHHLINPKTGYPADGAISATVISDDAISADAYSTAAFVLGVQNWLFVRTVFPKNNAEVFLVAPDQQIFKTDGFSFYEQIY
ncbi:FAD:protein FMN transferase [Thermosipho atlanticus]|uniref:FAD:protein FMN transferase n=1 Tax=Thermosipho atlanticus DSM 15807 TaxID=1123380 RepID=A0A1M5QNZ1_9BACT|nr:FAD:protein FMN transferase [Thermosipho atlanticus]SHH15591.1 thiamine biosynthesis lipoprotein [Thermosipho atlanticus DSM 15807]